MDAEKKKPGLALVVGMAKAKPKASEEEAEGEDDGAYSASTDELFDALKADDRAAFAEAFKAAVMSCKK